MKADAYRSMEKYGFVFMHFFIYRKSEKMELKNFFSMHPKVAVACSGGIDSAFLLYQAGLFAEDVKAYFVQSAFQPEFELQDAKKMCRLLSIELKIIQVDVLKYTSIVDNPEHRCYFCKKEIFGAIKKEAEKDGYHILLDGTNASDDVDDRPGVKALKEYGVKSPLRECGYSKEMIRKSAKQADIFLYKKPAYACLATRIPYGTKITKELLDKIEVAENILFTLGFTDFRVRIYHEAAKIQLKEDEIPIFIKKKREIITELENYFEEIFLDMKVSR